ncbi:hypothetical protein ACFLTH_16880 [Bacteroidota bacterium]
MKRGVLFVLFLIICSSSVIAFDNIYSGYVYTLDTFTVEDDIFYVTLANNDEVLVLHKNDDELFFVYNGTCEDTAYYQYCFMGTKLDYDDYGRQIPNTYRWEPALKVEIYSKKPSITVTRTVDSEINMGDKTIVKVTVTNNGELQTDNLVFRETLPENVVVNTFDSQFITVSGSELEWNYPSLLKDKSVYFIYTLIPKNYSNIVLSEGVLNYTYEDSDFGLKTTTSTIVINSPFSKTSSVNKNNVGVGEEFIYSYKITNEDWDDKLDVEYSFKKPENVEIVDVALGFQEEDFDLYTFKLSPSESEEFTITMKSAFVGNHSIEENTKLFIRNDVYEERKEHNVSVTLPLMIPELKLSKTEVFEGGPYTVYVYMENTAEVSFYEISGTLSSDLFGTQNINQPIIGANDKIKLFEKSLSAVPVDENTNYDINLRGNYKSQSQQIFSYAEFQSITVKSVTIGFDIIKTANKQDVYPGENITVSVSVKNLGQSISVIKLKENISEPLRVISGLTEKTLTLDIGAEEEFYIYKVIVPVGTKAGTYNLRTDLDYGSGIVSETENLIITVRQPEVEETEDAIVEENQEEENKVGWFRGILNFFEEIFKS